MERRKFIKTTIPAAVLTLPGTSVLANASAFQCVYEEEKRDEAQPAISPDFTEDNYVRTAALVAEYRKNGEDNAIDKVYTLEYSGVSFLEDGTEVDLNDYTRITDQVNVDVLVVYDNEIDDEGNHVVYILGPWPAVQMTKDNHPLTVSCLASFETNSNRA